MNREPLESTLGTSRRYQEAAEDDALQHGSPSIGLGFVRDRYSPPCCRLGRVVHHRGYLLSYVQDPPLEKKNLFRGS